MVNLLRPLLKVEQLEQTIWGYIYGSFLLVPDSCKRYRYKLTNSWLIQRCPSSLKEGKKGQCLTAELVLPPQHQFRSEHD